MKKLKLLSLLAIVALLTVPANAANAPGRCAAIPVNAAGYCVTIPRNVAGDCVTIPCNAAGDCVTIPCNAAGDCVTIPCNIAGDCATIPCNIAGDCATIPANVAGDCATARNDASCTILNRCAGAWGRFTFPAFLFSDTNANAPAANPTPAAPDSNTPPAVPGSDASAPDSNDAAPEKPSPSDSPATNPTPSTPSATPAPNSNAPTVPDSSASAPADTETAGMSAYELEVVRLVNVERAKYGLSALSADGELSRIARYKSQDMRDKGYFSHESPTYGSPFQMLKSFGVSYRSAGENIAYGYATPEKVVNAWMNSEGHRANILNASYTRLGVGYVASGDYWTQLFVG